MRVRARARWLRSRGRSRVLPGRRPPAPARRIHRPGRSGRRAPRRGSGAPTPGGPSRPGSPAGIRARPSPWPVACNRSATGSSSWGSFRIAAVATAPVCRRSAGPGRAALRRCSGRRRSPGRDRASSARPRCRARRVRRREGAGPGCRVRGPVRSAATRLVPAATGPYARSCRVAWARVTSAHIGARVARLAAAPVPAASSRWRSCRPAPASARRPAHRTGVRPRSASSRAAPGL